MRVKILFFVLATLAQNRTGLANPSAASNNNFREALLACNFVKSHPREMNLQRFEDYELPRYLTSQADPTVMTSNETVDGASDPRTRGAVLKQCDELFNSIAKENAEAFNNPKVVAPRGELALGDCLTRPPRDAGVDTGYFEKDLTDFRTARLRMSISYPALPAVDSTLRHGALAEGTTYGALFDACETRLRDDWNASKKRSDAHVKNERDIQAKEAADGAARDKKWMSLLKGDKLTIYKAWNHAIPENDIDSTIWTYQIFAGENHCTYTYSFKGNTLANKTHSDEAGCSRIKTPY